MGRSTRARDGGGVFRSRDGGASWQAASAGLTNTDVQALALDSRDGTLYAGTYTFFRVDDVGVLRVGDVAVFRSRDNGTTWQYNEPSAEQIYAGLGRGCGYGLVTRSGASLQFFLHGGGPLWAGTARWGPVQGTLRPLPSGRVELLRAWGATIARAELGAGYRTSPVGWLALRAWVWRNAPSVTRWITANVLRWAIGLAVLVSLFVAMAYVNLCRPFGLPLWAPFLARRHLDQYARAEALDARWPEWRKSVRTELLGYGAVQGDDLAVPPAFRRYALRRYEETCASTLLLENTPGGLRLLSGDRLRRWHRAWATASSELGTRAGLTPRMRPAIDALGAVLAEVLGLTPSSVRDFQAVRGCQVEAPTLRLRLPPRFPLVFVADPRPGPATVQMLVDAVDVLKESGYFALVVPLEPPVREVDVAAELRQVVQRSAHVQDFIVLSEDDILDILIARQPVQVLVQRILAQVDLTVVSPFVVSGPVPDNMFFGREEETKTLTQSAATADFAIIGNRKIGKTSLLQRTRRRLSEGGRAQPLLVDCQTVRDAESFYRAFQAQTGVTLQAETPDGFATAVTNLSRQAHIPIVLMDEVDALLANERARGEPLAATWRTLAQAGICRFIFCGSTGLARRLDDASSVFFNFPQRLPIGYLKPETASLVLTQPLETLGILLEDKETVLREMLRLTSGHPNLVQYVGRGLVEAANRRGERRIILDDLRAVCTSTSFSDFYLRTVWGEAGALEKLVTLVAPAEGFVITELERALEQHDIQATDEALDAALNMLSIYSILERRGHRYTFVPLAFPTILRETQEVARLIAQEKRRLLSGGEP